MTGPRNAVRFGLPLMSGTPGVELARKGVEPTSSRSLSGTVPVHLFTSGLAPALSASALIHLPRAMLVVYVFLVKST